MPHIPNMVPPDDILYLEKLLAGYGFKRVHQGKVRDTYMNSDNLNEMAVVATDRISIFDFVLPVTIPNKGAVLTALTHFWMTYVLPEFGNHLTRSRVKPRLNGAYDIRKGALPVPQARILVVKKLQMLPYEMIFRAHIGGSVWKSYDPEVGMIAGVLVGKHLTRWMKLSEPAFTPSTKAQEGHDVNITYTEFIEDAGKILIPQISKLRKMYEKAYNYALDRGILILDTKFEIGWDGTIGDEILTPDSSRFTTVDDWREAMKQSKDPIFYDKEPVRIWGRSIETPFFNDNGEKIIGINNLDPKNSDHLQFVDGLIVPTKVVYETTRRYLDIFNRLTGEALEDYQSHAMS